MDKLKTYALLAETLVILVLSAVLWKGCRADRTGSVLPSDGTVSRVTVTSSAPLVGLDKQQLRKRGAITKDVAGDPGKAVLASGKIKDDCGSRNVAAVLDTKTGETQLIEKRPVIEAMKRFRIGIGYGFESGDPAQAISAEATLGRFGPFYFSGRAEYFIVDRLVNRHPWNAMAFVALSF